MSDNNLTAKADELRADFAAVTGHPFDHFYCPILFRDEDTRLCRAHVVNEAFRGAHRAWTVQRADVDNFFGSAFEGEFVLLQEKGQHSNIDVLADKDLARKLKPKIMLDGQEVEHYRPGSVVPPNHSPFILEREGYPTTRLALKMTVEEALGASERKWDVRVERDLRLPSLVSLIKAAHLTMFYLMDYDFALSAGGHFVGYDVLGKFFLQNKGLAKRDILANADAHFRPFVNMVRPVLSAPEEIKGTVTDRRLYLCTSDTGAWAYCVLVRTGKQLHAVLLPVMEDPDNAARYLAFLASPAPQFEVRFTEFAGDRWNVSPERRTFVWPEANFT